MLVWNREMKKEREKDVFDWILLLSASISIYLILHTVLLIVIINQIIPSMIHVCTMYFVLIENGSFY